MDSVAEMLDRVARSREGAANPNLTYSNLHDYVHRTPRLAEQYRYTDPPPRDDKLRFGQILGEAAAVADPFGARHIQEMLGIEKSPMLRINEAHGLAQKESDRLWTAGKAPK